MSLVCHFPEFLYLFFFFCFYKYVYNHWKSNCIVWVFLKSSSMILGYVATYCLHWHNTSWMSIHFTFRRWRTSSQVLHSLLCMTICSWFSHSFIGGLWGCFYLFKLTYHAVVICTNPVEHMYVPTECDLRNELTSLFPGMSSSFVCWTLNICFLGAGQIFKISKYFYDNWLLLQWMI